MRTLLTAVVGLAVLSAAPVRAAEIKVLASNGVKSALEELAPAFERDTGNKLVIAFGLAAALKRQIEAGEPSTSRSSPAPGSRISRSRARSTAPRAPPSRVRRGIGIKKGGPARHRHVRRAQAHAARREIDHLGEGRPERHLLRGLLEKIGIAEQMKPKVVPAASGVKWASSSPRAGRARRDPRQRIDGRAGSKSWAAAGRAAELHRLPCRRRRGIEDSSRQRR